MSESDRIETKYVVVGMTLTVVAFLTFKLSVSQPDRHPLIFALALSWVVVVIVASLTYQIFLRFALDRFQVAYWERSDGLYERVGVGIYRWILLHTPIRLLSNPQVRLKCGRSDLDRLLREINAAEGVHITAGIATFVISAAYAFAGYATIGMWMLLINILLNIYPVMLQRMNRVRVRRLIGRRESNSPLCRTH